MEYENYFSILFNILYSINNTGSGNDDQDICLLSSIM